MKLKTGKLESTDEKAGLHDELTTGVQHSQHAMQLKESVSSKLEKGWAIKLREPRLNTH